MRKKLLSILLVLSLMLALVPAAFAADIVDSGTCGAEGDGSNVTWMIDKNGVLTVTGTGAITSDAMQIRQLSYRSDVTSAVIGEGITDMGELWMSGYTSLVSVSFPDTITLLKNVCCNCPELTSVRFPAKLESLVGAFTGCKSLTMIALPDTLKFISGSFVGCEGLTEIVIPEGVTALGEGVFDWCTSLVRLTLPSTLQEIGSLCFGECRALKSVSIPEGITRLESHLFYNCTGLESISLPASLTSIGYLTFSGASNVKVVCYAGTEEQWKNISISVDTSTAKPSIPFDGAKICYEHSDHVFDPLTNTPATCTDDGRIAGTCTVCGYSMDTVLPAYGHIWNSGTLLTAPDGVRCGIVEHTCSRCNGTGYEVLDPEIWAYEQFGDVDPTLWSYEGIQFCVMMGYMSGMDTHVFAPRGVTTRAQLVQILYNFVGGPEVSGETPFTDLTANWYKDAVLWAYQTGVTSGTSETTFAPDDPVTREQVAVLLYEFADKVLEVGGAETPADLSRFPDGDQVSSWAREAMADAVALGIINGTKVDDQVFLAPQGSATRDQIATMFEGFCASLA